MLPRHYDGYKEIPIRLADVLRVLKQLAVKSGRVKKGDKKSIFESADSACLFAVINRWNLLKNNLDLQSKETIDFLTNLICKKNE